MQITQTSSENLLSFNITPDDLNNSLNCLNMRIIIDTENCMLIAVGDCGNYVYTGTPAANESFVKLLTTLNSSYLLNKISKRSRIDVNASIENTIKNLNEYFELTKDNDQIKDAIINALRTEIPEQFGSYEGEYAFPYLSKTIISILDRYDIDACSTDLTEIAEIYPPQAYTFMTIYETVLVPYLKKYLETKHV